MLSRVASGGALGRELLAHLRRLSSRRMLAGTWSAADWAIGFYQRQGFSLVSAAAKMTLLKTYWTVPDRQIETSVVLANPPLEEARWWSSVSNARPASVACDGKRPSAYSAAGRSSRAIGSGCVSSHSSRAFTIGLIRTFSHQTGSSPQR